MRTVGEMSAISGVSVRTLHHYDAIGLLKPTATTDAGYRLYDEGALERLQAILLLRELTFPLEEIKRMLDSPAFDISAALDDRIRLLELQRCRLDRLIALARSIRNGENTMEFNAADTHEHDAYREEAKARWGKTAAYAEYEKKTAGRSGSEISDAGAGLMSVIASVAAMRPLPPDDPAVAAKARGIQAFITENFYTCTDEIFASLAQMYTADERMKKNIDKAAGEGAAEYVSRAIKSCLK